MPRETGQVCIGTWPIKRQSRALRSHKCTRKSHTLRTTRELGIPSSATHLTATKQHVVCTHKVCLTLIGIGFLGKLMMLLLCPDLFFPRAEAVLAKAAVHSHFKHKAGKSKRMRTSFTNEQLTRLEKEFARQQYMVGSERFLLASALQLTEAQVNKRQLTFISLHIHQTLNVLFFSQLQVKVWFQNRRIKWRKQSLEQQQAKLAKLGLAVQPKSPGSQGREDEERDFTEESDVDIDIDDSLQD